MSPLANHRSAERSGIAVVHANGNENVRQVLQALDENSMLAEFSTTLAWGKDNSLPSHPAALRQTAAKRSFDMVTSHQISRSPSREILRNVLGLVPVKGIRRLSEVGQPFGIEWVSRGLDAKVAARLGADLNPTAILGYQNKSLRLFRRAAQLEIGRVIEITHAHWRMTQEIYDALESRSPEWASTTTVPSSRVRDEADEELSLADAIMSPSRQVTESILSVMPEANIYSAPYGCPQVDPSFAPINWDGEGKIKVIFVGRLQAGKGLADLAVLAQATKKFVDLTVIGAAPSVRSRALEDFIGSVRYLGTMPRVEVLREMRRNHVFILPSLVEGRSLAALEAISVGMPMIVTPGSGVDDLVELGAGYVSPVGVPAGLIDALEKIRESPEIVAKFSEQALQIARDSSWKVYRDRVASILSKWD